MMTKDQALRIIAESPKALRLAGDDQRDARRVLSRLDDAVATLRYIIGRPDGLCGACAGRGCGFCCRPVRG